MQDLNLNKRLEPQQKLATQINLKDPKQFPNFRQINPQKLENKKPKPENLLAAKFSASHSYPTSRKTFFCGHSCTAYLLSTRSPSS